MIEFEIDGKKLTSELGKMIIEVADNAGIYIPRFCYHKKLSIAANCRMCLVEVEKSGKPLPACATPITSGMKVFTRSNKALAAQRSVMEFLLINHPLDCPICDQGGECELQDLSMGYGPPASRYRFPKRSVHDKNLGPLISSEMTRCIQCTRCVRFGEEIAGMRELGAYNRGEHLEIGSYMERAVKSEVSGNVIDICPVGALTSKPFRFIARAWEMKQHPSIAPHDCLGSNIFVHTRSEEYTPFRHVMRVVPRFNDSINEVWLSDRDRFSYEGLHHGDRIVNPLIKRNGKWETTDWQTALNFVGKNLQKIIEKYAAKTLGAIASPNSTLEEFYLLQKLWRGLGSNNIDHRIHQMDFSDENTAPAYPRLGISLEDLEKQNIILLIGSNVRHEQPLASVRIRKANLQDAQVMCINPIDYKFNFDVSEKIIVSSELIPLTLAKLAQAATKEANLYSDIEVGKTEHAIISKLKQGEKAVILLGAQALNHPQAAAIQTLAEYIAAQTGATLGCFSTGGNAAGGWIAGALPHREALGQKAAASGLNAYEMFADPLKAYLLLNVEPELDCANSAAAIAALKAAEFVVCLSPFNSLAMEEYAHVILPISPFTENSGTLINVEGRWQRFEATGPCLGDSRPAWKVLRVLGNLLALPGFEYNTTHEIHSELFNKIETIAQFTTENKKLPKKFSAPKALMRISEWPMYRSDNLVRRSQPLQAALESDVAFIRINSNLAKQLHLHEGELVDATQKNTRVTLPLRIDDRIADNNVLLAAGIAETAGFGESFGVIELRRA